MKIIHIVSSLDVGGAERFVIDLAAEQVKANNCSVTVLSMGRPGEPLEDEVKRFGIGLKHATAIRQLNTIFKEFDIVHVHSSYALLRALLACVFLSTRVIYTRHNERVHTTLKWRLTYKFAQFKLHKMVFVAEKARQNYLRVYPEFRQKSCTILNGVLPMVIEKLPCDRMRLAHVGRFVPLKAQHILIKALSVLPRDLQDQLSVSFYGTGELMETNKELAKTLIPNIEVNFKGFVTDRNEIYQQSDVLVVTSETEGLSLAILEALASGTPTIASNVGGNAELVEHDKNGYLYPFADSEKLAFYINSLMTSKESYQSFSEKSLGKFQEGFSMTTCAGHYLNSYN